MLRFLTPVCFLKLNLRLKALKRQMDEAEEEIDRLEHSKKKLQRDLDEQQEANDQLQSQLKALRSEMRWTVCHLLQGKLWIIRTWVGECTRMHSHCPGFSHTDVRATLPRCSTTWMMKMMMTLALTGRRTSARPRVTNAPPVRTTSCPPSRYEHIKLLYMRHCGTKLLQARASCCHSLNSVNIDICSDFISWFDFLFVCLTSHSPSVLGFDVHSVLLEQLFD